MFNKPSDSSKANLSYDGGVPGDSSTHQTGPTIRIDNLGQQELSVVRRIIDIAYDPYATWEMVTQEVGARYGHTEHAQLAAHLIQTIAETGAKDLGAYVDERIQVARESHYEKIREVKNDLVAAATVLADSRNEAAHKRATMLTRLTARMEEVGPYLALREVDMHIRPPLSTGCFERVTSTYIAAMFCENPVDALEFMLDESASKVVNYIDAGYLRDRFARNGGKFISDRDMRELARKTL